MPGYKPQRELAKPELIDEMTAVLNTTWGEDGKPQGWVLAKVTCPACGERLTGREPNLVHDSYECDFCGVLFPFTKGGYALVLAPPEQFVAQYPDSRFRSVYEHGIPERRRKS